MEIQSVMTFLEFPLYETDFLRYTVAVAKERECRGSCREDTMRRENQIYCNRCGRRIEQDEKKLREDFFHAEKVWGYFSQKDGERHSFDLCESCYDDMLKEFALEIRKEEETELL